MSWIIPDQKLDDQQHYFIENVDINKKNVWIMGFPGSGKSVLLAYTVKRIKRDTPKASVAVVVFTRSLIAMFREAFIEMGMSAHIMTYYEFLNANTSYDYVLSDEVQDMTGRVLQEMNRRAKHVIVAGDENQSIYDKDPKYGEPTVSSTQIMGILDCSSFQLNEVHRLSSSIIAAVEKFMPNINIFSSKRDMTKKNTQIRLCTAKSEEQEIEYIMKEAQKAVNIGETAAILLPSQRKVMDFVQMVLKSREKKLWNVQENRYQKTDYGRLNNYLAMNGIKLQYVGNGYGTFTGGGATAGECKIIVMTYHSSKGLDFENVFLPGLNQSFFISGNNTLSHRLFMVAMTRSRNNLYLTYSGVRSAYLSSFASDCSNINISNILNGQSSIGNRTNVFGI